jgi:hypothetical protein
MSHNPMSLHRLLHNFYTYVAGSRPDEANDFYQFT